MPSETRDSVAEDPIVLARERPFRLGAVEVRPSTREVITPRGRVSVEPRVMQVLVALAQARGEILDRDALIARCWEGRIVGEDAISRVISRLRRLSDGLGRDGWSLETVTKVGYRLVPAGSPGEDLATLPAPAQRIDRRVWLAGAAGLVAAGGAGVGVWQVTRRTPSEADLLLEKGIDALHQATAEDMAQAVVFLREAVAQAPDNAAAWGALALAYQKSLTYTPPDRQAGIRASALGAARRALELDPDSPHAATAQALLTPAYRNWAEAESRQRRALRLSPDEPTLLMAHDKLLLSVGRLREAVPFAERAVAADSMSPFYRYALALSLWGAGRTEEAEQTLSRALKLWPRHYALWFLQFHLFAHSGRADRALAMGGDSRSRPSGIPEADIDLSLISARALATKASGDIGAAIEANLAAARRGVGYAENAMGWMTAYGRPDDAIRIARAMFFGEGFTIGGNRFSPDQGRFRVTGDANTHFLFMPPLSAMRARPEWPKLVADLGITAYWRTTGRRPDDLAWTRVSLTAPSGFYNPA